MSIKVRIFTRQRSSHQFNTAHQLISGFKRHAVKDVAIGDPGGQEPCDLAIFWGHKQYRIIKAQRQCKADYMVMERAYVGDRFKFISLGYNGLNGSAEFHNADSPADRWEKHFGAEWLKPWLPDGSGDYVLLIGQVARDASVRNICISAWLAGMAKSIKAAYPHLPVRYRPHPDDVRKGHARPIPGTKYSTRKLAEDLSGAICVVTYNSNTGVDAVLAGVPVVVCNQGSMVFGLGPRLPKDPLKRPDRTQWARNIAYCQWLPDEIASGEAWDHLRKHYAG